MCIVQAINDPCTLLNHGQYVYDHAYIHNSQNNSDGSCSFGKICTDSNKASEMCRRLVEPNCRIPTTPMNDCWLDKYKSCKEKCGTGGTEGMCRCTDYATEQCVTSNEPANSCFRDLHQKCMAGAGFASDPDRGPFPHFYH